MWAFPLKTGLAHIPPTAFFLLHVPEFRESQASPEGVVSDCTSSSNAVAIHVKCTNNIVTKIPVLRLVLEVVRCYDPSFSHINFVSQYLSSSCSMHIATSSILPCWLHPGLLSVAVSCLHLGPYSVPHMTADSDTISRANMSNSWGRLCNIPFHHSCSD